MLTLVRHPDVFSGKCFQIQIDSNFCLQELNKFVVRRERPTYRPEPEVDLEVLEKKAQGLPLDETKIIIVDGYRKRVPINSTRATSQGR